MRRLLIIVGLVTLSLILVLLAMPGCAKPAPAEKTKLVLLASDTGTTAYMWAATFASIVNKYSDKQEITVTPTKGFIDAFYRFIDGKGDLVTTSGFTCYLVSEGTAMKGRDEPWVGSKDVLPLYKAGQHWLTAAESKYNTVADCKGSRFGTFQPGNQSTITALWILEAAGLDPEKDLTIRTGTSTDIVGMLKDGSLDVITVGSGVPSPLIVDLCNYKDIKMIPMTEDILAKVGERGKGGVVKVVIPGGYYKGIDSDVVQPGWANHIAAMKDFPEDLVYDACYLWATHLDEAKEANAVVKREATAGSFERPGPATSPSSEAMLKAWKDTGLIEKLKG